MQQERALSYSEIIGAMLRQERQTEHPAFPESVLEQIVNQLEKGTRVDELDLDLSGLATCPQCEPDLPCVRCQTDRHEMLRAVKDHLRRIEATGKDPLEYITEANRFHSLWQERFEQLHLAAMGGEAAS